MKQAYGLVRKSRAGATDQQATTTSSKEDKKEVIHPRPSADNLSIDNMPEL